MAHAEDGPRLFLQQLQQAQEPFDACPDRSWRSPSTASTSAVSPTSTSSSTASPRGHGSTATARDRRTRGLWSGPTTASAPSSPSSSATSRRRVRGHATSSSPSPTSWPRGTPTSLYLLESVEAAVGIATDRLREEIGAAVFKAQARVILDRIRYCYRGNRAADARRHLQQARWRSRAEHARSHGRPRGRYSLLHWSPQAKARENKNAFVFRN